MSSISSSAASSPIPEEYALPGSFIPVSDHCRTSPEALMAQVYGAAASPSSPRPRTGSLGGDEFQQQRRRCYSFHLNSEGQASRLAMHQKMVSGGPGGVQPMPDSQHYLPVEQRRSSVGAACGLHARKRSLLVDRHPAYVGSAAVASAATEGLRPGHQDKRFLASSLKVGWNGAYL